MVCLPTLMHPYAPMVDTILIPSLPWHPLAGEDAAQQTSVSREGCRNSRGEFSTAKQRSCVPPAGDPSGLSDAQVSRSR